MEIKYTKKVYYKGDNRLVRRFLFWPKFITTNGDRTKTFAFVWFKLVYLRQERSRYGGWDNESLIIELPKSHNVKMLNEMLISKDDDIKLALEIIRNVTKYEL